MKNLLILIRFLLLLGLAFSTAFNLAAKSRDKPEQANYRISRCVFGSGGITGSTGTDCLLFATVGEAAIDNVQDGSKILLSGYWHKVFSVIPNGEQNETSVMPEAVELHQNYPNPFNSQTTIEYGLPYSSEVTVEVYNLLGERIHLLLNSQIQGPGFMKIIWNGCNDHGIPVDPGVYLYRISVSKATPGNQKVGTLYQLTRKMLVVK